MGTIRQTTAQSITVDYIVTEELDGETLAPEVIIDTNAINRTAFDPKTQIFQPDPVPKLGLIDPDLLVGGSIGARCIPFLSLDTSAAGDAGGSVDIVGVREAGEPDVFFQKQIRDISGIAGPIYHDGGFNVPQGSDIRLDGMTAPAGAPLRVRVTIGVLKTCQDIAAFRCACDEASCPPVLSPFPFTDTVPQPDPGWIEWQADGGDSPFLALLYDGDLDPGVRLQLSVDKLSTGAPPTVAVFEDPLFPSAGPLPTATVANVTPATSTALALVELEFDFSAVTVTGVCHVRLSNPCGCATGFGVRFGGRQ